MIKKDLYNKSKKRIGDNKTYSFLYENSIIFCSAYSKLIFFIKTFEVSRVIRELALLKLLIQNISLLYAVVCNTI